MPLNYKRDNRYEHLSNKQVQQIYEEESALRRYLIESPKEKRAEAFCWAYDELFRRCPWHPALTEKSGASAPELIQRRVSRFLGLLPNQAHVLEIGCGMGELSIGLSQRGYQCLGIDVSDVRIKRLQQLQSATLRFEKVEGTHLPFPDSGFDAAISMQLFEHLHPEDAAEHLKEVSRVLKPAGVYLLETPNRLTGPGDVSRFFCETAEGFHLKEYTIGELVRLLRQAGFSEVQVLLRWRRRLSASAAIALERLWSILPKAIRRRHSFGLHNPLYLARTPLA